MIIKIDVMLFFIKSFLPLRIVEFIWLQRLTLPLCLKVNFLLKKVFIEEVFSSLVNMTMTKYV
jgi:hypothetical protein